MKLPRFVPAGSHIGIDVSKHRLDIAVHPGGEVWQCGQTPQDLAALAQFLARHQVALVLLEATGRYGHGLCASLHRAGVPVRVENPVRVRHFARSTGTVAKTDRIDARLLARMAAVLEPSPNVQLTDIRLEMADLAARRDQLVMMRGAEQVRLDPEPANPLIKQQLLDHIQMLDRQIGQIEQRLDDLIASDRQMAATRAAFEAVKGVGGGTVRTLLAAMPEIGHLNRRQAAALAGVAPVTNQSGQRSGTASIGNGRTRIRRALYMAALSAARWNPHLKAFYQRLTNTGHKPKQALIAVARKLLIHLNSLAAKQLKPQPQHT